MSLSPFDSFQSRFVTYLLYRPRTTSINIVVFDVIFIIVIIIGIQPLGRSGQRLEFSQATGYECTPMEKTFWNKV